MKARRPLALLITALLTTCAAQAQKDLTHLDLSTLISMDVTVTSRISEPCRMVIGTSTPAFPRLQILR